MVHVVYVRQMQIVGGQVINKNSATIAEMTKSSMEMRVVPDSDAPNSASSPSIKNYLVAEDGAGFTLVHMDNTIIVTKL